MKKNNNYHLISYNKYDFVLSFHSQFIIININIKHNVQLFIVYYNYYYYYHIISYVMNIICMNAIHEKKSKPYPQYITFCSLLLFPNTSGY